MKTRILVITVALALSGTAALAQQSDRDYHRVAYSTSRHDSLEGQIHHLNRMLEHVRWQARHYRADWRVRREVEDVSREVDRLNHRVRSNDYNGWRLRREVDRLHDRLHWIEERLHVRSRDIYRWD
jgi:hypothetical protein